MLNDSWKVRRCSEGREIDEKELEALIVSTYPTSRVSPACRDSTDDHILSLEMLSCSSHLVY